MAQRSVHYEAAFERYLRSKKIPYIAVDEAKKTLFPHGVFGGQVVGQSRSMAGASARSVTQRAEHDGTSLDECVVGERDTVGGSGGVGGVGEAGGAGGRGRPVKEALKSFDFVIYGEGANLLIEIKGRKAGTSVGARLENWVTIDDVQSLLRWEQLFGAGFEACFLFIYWFDVQPPDALFEELIESDGLWYGLRAVSVREYAKYVRIRSQRWRTCDISRSNFDEISQPFAPTCSLLRLGSDARLCSEPEHGDKLPILPILTTWQDVWGGALAGNRR